MIGGPIVANASRRFGTADWNLRPPNFSLCTLAQHWLRGPLSVLPGRGANKLSIRLALLRCDALGEPTAHELSSSVTVAEKVVQRMGLIRYALAPSSSATARSGGIGPAETISTG